MAIYRLNDDTQKSRALCDLRRDGGGGLPQRYRRERRCAKCGMPMVYSPSERGSYFEVVMRLGRPGPAMWPRRSA